MVTKKMSADKILELIKQNPSLSSKNVFDKLKHDDPNFTESYRTVQKHLTDMHREGILETHSIGREVVYSPKQNTNAGTQDYFMTHIWNRLFTFNEKLVHYRSDFSYLEFADELDSIVEMLPPRMKEQIKVEFQELEERTIKETDPDWTPGKEMTSDQGSHCDDKRFHIQRMGIVTDKLHSEIESKTA
jgi:predicted transcriptional regulator